MNSILHNNNTTKYLLFLLFAIFCLSIVILASTPPICRDGLTHHLFVPKLWLQAGNIAPIKDIVFSYYPMNLDLLYLIPLSMGNDIVPKYIHFFFALATGWMIFSYLAKRLSPLWGMYGALFFISLPVIIKLSITVYVDLGVIAFTTASLLLLLHWRETGKIHHLLFAALFCGLATGTKYNALISLFLLTALTPIIYIRSHEHKQKFLSVKAIAYTCLFVIVAITAYSPWLIRNFQATGNPIYPLHHSVISQLAQPETDPDSSSVANDTIIKDAARSIVTYRSSTFADRKVLYHETWWQALLLPVRFFFEGRDDDPRYFDGKLNPFLLLFMFFAFFFTSYSKQIRFELYILLSFGWLFFFFTFFQESLRIRYISSALPPFVIIATFGLHNISNRMKPVVKNNHLLHAIILVALTSPALLYNSSYLISQFKEVRPFDYITGKISRDDFISSHIAEYPIQKWANENLSETDKILALYIGKRGYYFDNPIVIDIDSNTSKLGTIIRQSSNPEEIFEKLTELNITHLFIRFDLFEKAVNQNLSREKIELLNDFFGSQTKLLVSNKQYGLLSIREKHVIE